MRKKMIVATLITIAIIVIGLGFATQQLSNKEPSPALIDVETEYLTITETDPIKQREISEQLQQFWNGNKDSFNETSEIEDDIESDLEIEKDIEIEREVITNSGINIDTSDEIKLIEGRSYYISFGAFSSDTNAERLGQRIQSDHSIGTSIFRGSNGLFLLFYEKPYPTIEKAIADQVKFNDLGLTNVIKYIEK